MSNDPTTKPTIETVLERINELRIEMNAQFKELRAEIDKGFRQIQKQFDRVTGEQSRQGAAIDDLEDRFDKIDKQPA